jgi:hypothetical protein
VFENSGLCGGSMMTRLLWDERMILKEGRVPKKMDLF